jgi:hypothetical protein
VTKQAQLPAVCDRTSSTRIWLSAGIFVALVQLALWNISEPETLFSDFYKAYYAAGKALLLEGPRQTWQIGEDTSLAFVNLPVLGYLFVPLALFERTTAGWIFLGIGAAASLATALLLARWLDFARPQVHAADHAVRGEWPARQQPSCR